MKLQMNNDSHNNSNSYLSNSLAPLPSFRTLPTVPGNSEIDTDDIGDENVVELPTLHSLPTLPDISSIEPGDNAPMIQIPSLPNLPLNGTTHISPNLPELATITIPTKNKLPRMRSYSPRHSPNSVRHSPRSVRHISPQEVQELIDESVSNATDEANVPEETRDVEVDISEHTDFNENVETITETVTTEDITPTNEATFHQNPISQEQIIEPEEVIVEEIIVPEVDPPTLNNEENTNSVSLTDENMEAIDDLERLIGELEDNGASGSRNNIRSNTGVNSSNIKRPTRHNVRKRNFTENNDENEPANESPISNVRSTQHPVSPRDQTPIYSGGQLLNRDDIPPISITGESIPTIELHPSTSISSPNLVPQYPSSSGRVTEVTRRTPKRNKIDNTDTIGTMPSSPRDAVPDLSRMSNIHSSEYISPSSPEYRVRDNIDSVDITSSNVDNILDEINTTAEHEESIEYEESIESIEEKEIVKSTPQHKSEPEIEPELPFREKIIVYDSDSDEYLEDYREEETTTATISRPTKPLPPDPVLRESIRDAHSVDHRPIRREHVDIAVSSNTNREPIDVNREHVNIETGSKPRRKIVRKRRVKRKKNGPNIPNFRAMSETEKAKWNADFNVKFGILREAYPEFDIPYFDNTTPLEIKHQHYDRYVKQIHIDNSVGNYRVYLLVLFAGIELFCVKVLGLDMSGYTINQLRLMNKYDRLLVELGEKTYSSVGSDWPVEARIVVMALFNGIIFLVVRLFASYLGPGLGDMMQNMVNNFLTGDKAEITDKDNKDGLPDPPVNNGGGFDLNSIINGLGGLFGGGNNSDKPRRRAPRRPAYAE